MHLPANNSAGAEALPLPVPHYSYELPTEEEERLEKLFRQLDVNGDGRIDVSELSQSLHIHGVPDNLKESYATVMPSFHQAGGFHSMDFHHILPASSVEIYPAVRLESEW